MEAEAYAELYAQESHHWWYRGMREITHRMLSSALSHNQQSDHAPPKILDVGCGVGGNLKLLAEFGSVCGLDYSALALGYALKTDAPQYGWLTHASVERLPYPDSVFDLITSFDVLYCREVQDDGVALAEIARLLRPDGFLYIRLPAFTSLRGQHDDVVHGVRRYTVSILSAKLRAVGLSPLRLTYANTFLAPLIFIVRQLQRLTVRSDTNAAVHSDVQPLPTPLNELLYRLLALEARWLNSGRNLPFGVSVIALASKSQFSYS